MSVDTGADQQYVGRLATHPTEYNTSRYSMHALHRPAGAVAGRAAGLAAPARSGPHHRRHSRSEYRWAHAVALSDSPSLFAAALSASPRCHSPASASLSCLPPPALPLTALLDTVRFAIKQNNKAPGHAPNYSMVALPRFTLTEWSPACYFVATNCTPYPRCNRSSKESGARREEERRGEKRRGEGASEGH